MKTLEDYRKEGYEPLPFRDTKHVNSFRTIDFSEEEIENLLYLDPIDRHKLLSPHEDRECVLFKAPTCHITPEMLLKAFTKLVDADYETHLEWYYVLNFQMKRKFVYIPTVFGKEEVFTKYDNDFLFKDNDHLVVYVLLAFLDCLKDKVRPDFDYFNRFIKDVLTVNSGELKEYSDRSLSEIVQNAGRIIERKKDKASQEIKDFYVTNLQALADRDDYQSMKTLGFEHYEGLNGFEVDFYKAEYYFQKCFRTEQDPDIANALGYIYYYGRTNNDIPKGDKAFQCFALAHFAGHNIEASYKLADCYAKGYGTQICYQAAYNIVRDLFNPTFRHFMNGDDSKFADVALRLGTYYENGLYVHKDLNFARIYYLEAREALKIRLQFMEYVGDRNVSIGIHNSLENLKQEFGYKGRTLTEYGYLIDHYEREEPLNVKFELAGNGYVRVIFKPDKRSNDKYLLVVLRDLNFSERAKKLEFLIKNDEINELTADSLSSRKINKIIFDKNKISIFYEDYIFDDTFDVDEIIYVPQTLKNYSKLYTVVSVEFYPNSKTYDYLCLNDNVSIDDKVTVMSKGQPRQVVVRAIKKLYEDELPLPLKKMAIAK